MYGMNYQSPLYVSASASLECVSIFFHSVVFLCLSLVSFFWQHPIWYNIVLRKLSVNTANEMLRTIFSLIFLLLSSVGYRFTICGKRRRTRAEKSQQSQWRNATQKPLCVQTKHREMNEEKMSGIRTEREEIVFKVTVCDSHTYHFEAGTKIAACKIKRQKKE